MRPHWFAYFHERLNFNKETRIEPLKPHPSTRKRKRRGSHLQVRVQRGENNINWNEELSVGELGRLGTDNLFSILTRLDVHSIISCLRVNRSLLTFITSPTFRRSWRGGKNVVLAGSRTLPWRLRTSEGDCIPFQPLNTPRCPGEVVASAAGLLCINMHPTTKVLELVVGNPVTREWVQLPVIEGDFDEALHSRPGTGVPDQVGPPRLSFRMEVFSEGRFKVAAYLGVQWAYRVFVYDSASDSWGLTELHYPGYSDSKWSDYDLTRNCWRLNLIAHLGRTIVTGLELWKCEWDHSHQLSHPFDHGFCVWEYRSTTFFASPWLGYPNRSLSGYAVWKLINPPFSTGGRAEPELVLVSARRQRCLAPHVPRSVYTNEELFQVYMSCNAFDNLVCFMGESGMHPPMPVVTYDVDQDSWAIFKDPIPPHLPVPIHLPHAVKACDHTSVAVAYTPSLLAPAALAAVNQPASDSCRQQEKISLNKHAQEGVESRPRHSLDTRVAPDQVQKHGIRPQHEDEQHPYPPHNEEREGEHSSRRWQRYQDEDRRRREADRHNRTWDSRSSRRDRMRHENPDHHMYSCSNRGDRRRHTATHRHSRACKSKHKHSTDCGRKESSASRGPA